MANDLITKENDYLESINSELTRRLINESSALGGTINSQRFIINSIEAVRQLKLSEKPVSPSQVVNGLMKGAYLHLDFFQKECYLIYYKDRGLTFQTDYKGEVKLAKQHSVKPVFEIFAEVVREGDEYEKIIHCGNRTINHLPKRFNDGKIEGAYAVVKYKDGSSDMVEISVKDIETIRHTYSKAPNSPAWTNRYVEMCKKTALRLLCKNIQLDFSKEQYEAYEEAGDCEFNNNSSSEETAINPFGEVKEPINSENDEIINSEIVVAPSISEEVGEPPSDFVCSACGSAISEKVYSYSINKFGKALCYKCQKEAR